MHLPNDPLKFRKNNQSFQIKLENLRLALGLSHSEWAEHLHMTQGGYEKSVILGPKVSLATMFRLSETFHFSLDKFWKNELDYRALMANHLAQNDTENSSQVYLIPEKYQVAPFSRTRTGKVMFDFLESKAGTGLVLMVFRHFQMNPRLFDNLDGWINNIFFTDMFNFLEEMIPVSRNFYYLMGRQSTITNCQTDLGKVYRQMKGPKWIYENLFGELMPFYERNSNYQILDLNHDHCIVRTRTKKEIATALRVRHLGSPSICQWKAGVFSAASGYIGLKDAQIRETHCVHRGDPDCVFEINYDHLF